MIAHHSYAYIVNSCEIEACKKLAWKGLINFMTSKHRDIQKKKKEKHT